MAVVDWPTFTQNLTQMFEASKSSKLDQIDSKTGIFHSSTGQHENCFIPDYIPQAGFQIHALICNRFVHFFENQYKLERVDKDLFAMSVCTVDGQRFHLDLVSIS